MPSPLSPAQLSRELRLNRAPSMNRRRWIVGLSLVGAGAGAVVGLYQMGVLRRLPDLPMRLFDATRVDRAPYAYKRLATPDGLLMLTSYGVTAALAGAGGVNRANRSPLLPLALLGKTLYDSFIAIKLGREEWAENKALCGYCQGATLASLASLALALPEARSAMQALAGRSWLNGSRPAF